MTGRLNVVSKAAPPRPSRLNVAGTCRYCLRRDCERISCVESYESTVCAVCGGTEYVAGHLDPEDASERCVAPACYGGLVMSRPKAV
ncbi:hypothetical protein [Nocardia sp. NPDC005366]|uniref:hypothetical protein n=1 Tax=Nocardia sp. NPDC005366 TaxID=3156878 RepID=UPI0033A1FFD7